MNIPETTTSNPAADRHMSEWHYDFYAKWLDRILDQYRKEKLPESTADGAHRVDDMICDLLANLSTNGKYF